MAEDERPLEEWPEDEGAAPHARPEFPSILRLLLRAAPRLILAVVLAMLYSASEGATALAFLLSWIVVVGSMLLPGWRRYVETGQRHKPPPEEPIVNRDGVPVSASPAGARVAAAREAAAREASAKERAAGEAAREAAARDKERHVAGDEATDPRDRWELPGDLGGQDPGKQDPGKQDPGKQDPGKQDPGKPDASGETP